MSSRPRTHAGATARALHSYEHAPHAADDAAKGTAADRLLATSALRDAPAPVRRWFEAMLRRGERAGGEAAAG